MENQNVQGFFDDAAKLFDKGISKARTVVSETSIEQRGFMKAFVRTCVDGFAQGWHEGNGGNLTYRMRDEEVSACRSFFDDEGGWTMLGVQADSLRGAYFVTTGAGKHFRTIGLDPASAIGIVEVSQAGDAWRLVWGLKGGQPTSEFTSHFMNHAVRCAQTGGASRVMYHAHPASLVALTLLEAPDSAKLTRMLWKSLTESLVVLPGGIGVLPWMVPGSREIALATSEMMEAFEAVMWPGHGIFCAGTDFEGAFGAVHTAEKAAGICLALRAAAGAGAKAGDMPPAITDDDLRAMAQVHGLAINEALLSQGA